MKCDKEKKWDIDCQDMESLELNAMIANSIELLGMFVYTIFLMIHTVVIKGVDAYKYPYHSIRSSMLFFGGSFSFHRIFQYLEKYTFVDDTVGFFQRMLLKSRKKIMCAFILLDIIPFVHSLFYLGQKEFVRAQINRDNPYNSKNIESIQDYSVESLMDAIQQNVLLTEGEKEAVCLLEPYFQENPYLDKEKAYLDLSTLDVCYEENNDPTILAQYFEQVNVAYIYNGNSLTHLPHEALHAMGDSNYRFLNEGVDALLISEYLDDGEMYVYSHYIYLTEIVIQMAGKNTVLEAFSKEDDQIILNKLAEKMGDEEALEFLNALDEYSNAPILDIDSFYSMGRTLFNCVQKMDLEVKQQAFIYNCFLHSYDTYLDFRYPRNPENSFENRYAVLYCLPKFWYNEEKDHSYPEYPVSYQRIIDTFENMIQDSHFRKHMDETVIEFRLDGLFDSFSENHKGKCLSRK